MTTERDLSRPAVIVPAYRRAGALSRLLSSIQRAHFPEGGIELIISLDGGAADDVVDCARSFSFSGGTPTVIERDEQLGLREHILWCGDQAAEHGAVIVLEDDLVVDPWFYHYAMHALAAHEREEHVAGIALYAPRYNEFVGLPFEPLANGTSAYRMQVPCSWGQAWTAAQWAGFREWYARAGDNAVSDCDRLPETVRRWPASSWKKHFAAYLVTEERHFVYPYQSLTSNCADPDGVHASRGTDELQVALPDPGRSFREPVFAFGSEAGVAYDAFMEPAVDIDFAALSQPPGTLCVDLYGSRPHELLRQFDYCLTTRPVKAAIRHYPLKFHPLPMNVLVEEADVDSGPIRLCRRDQLHTSESSLKRRWAKNRLRLYFVSGPRNGSSLIWIGLALLLDRLRGTVAPH